MQNKESDKLKQQLKEILESLDRIDVASLVTHYENQLMTSSKLTRLRQFVSQLQTVLGSDHHVCQALRNCDLFKVMKLNHNFKSSIVINLDSVADQKSAGHKSMKEEIEEQLDSAVFATPNPRNEAQLVFESMLEEGKKHKRQRSVQHKQRKNMRSELNKAKKELLNGLNL